MFSNSYKSKIKSLVSKVKEKNLVKSYAQFCQTEVGKNSALSKDEISYYTSICEECSTMAKSVGWTKEDSRNLLQKVRKEAKNFQ